MTPLKCEICGGKLVAKAGGIFECDSCGMQYDKTRVQEMVQEIKGTVSVEGTVNVEGTVKVDGGVVTGSSLIKNGTIALEDENWGKAAEYFKDSLKSNPEDFQAYLGQFLARQRIHNVEEIKDMTDLYFYDTDFLKALKYADAANKELIKNAVYQYADQWLSYPESSYDINRGIQAYEFLEDYKDCPEKVRELKAMQKKKCEEIEPMIRQYSRVNCLCGGGGHVFAIGVDGKVYSASSKPGECPDVSRWKDIVSLVGCHRGSEDSIHVIGLKRDGTVVAAGGNAYGQCNVNDWTDIVQISCYGDTTFGVRKDGRVFAVGDNFDGRAEVSGWTDIVRISCGYHFTTGLKKDGTVVCTNAAEQKLASPWTNIVSVFSNTSFITGLKDDGTVVRTKDDSSFSSMKDILYIGDYSFLKKDGTVVSSILAEYEKQYRGIDVVRLFSFGGIDRYGNTVGKDICGLFKDAVEVVCPSKGVFVCLRKDGTVTTNRPDMYDVSKWKLFDNYVNIDKERDEINQSKKDKLIQDIKDLKEELGSASGLFAGMKKKEIEKRIAECENELSSLG